ncbi:MAG: DUF285 domain-containing protein, partial [Muribaculaceae bacterium]|nr:DUF285 domain-containing protein [Muribaculaceae bacterium]
EDMSEILRKIRVPLESGEIRELEMPVQETPKIPDVLDHLGELSFIQCTLQEYNNIPSPGSKTVYFVHTPSRLLKIMLGKKLIWRCTPNEIEYINTTSYSASKNNRIEYKNSSSVSGSISINQNTVGFPLRYNLDNRLIKNIYLNECSYLRISCSTTSNNLTIFSDTPVVDFSSIDTSNINDMTSMCQLPQVTELDVSSFATGRVTSMKNMFKGCGKLKKLDVRSFETSKVQIFYGMFQDCIALESLATSWNLNSATDVRWMFKGCSSLNYLLIDWSNTNRIITLEGMFEGCTSVKNLDLVSLRISPNGDGAFIRMFAECELLKELDIRNFDFENNTCQPRDMFYRCVSLKTLIFGKNYRDFTLDFGDCPLTHKSAMSVINGLKQCTKEAQLIFSAETFNTLTQEELALALSLGFTVVS